MPSLIENHPFFSGLKPELMELISGSCQTDLFKEGEYIFKQGDAADKFYVISGGKVSVEIETSGSHPFSIQTLKEGDILGWSWFVEPHQARFSARAIERCELVVIDGKAIREACEKNHDLGYDIFKRLAGVFAQRLEASRQRLHQFYNHS